MPHADMQHAAPAHEDALAAPADEHNPAIKDAAMTLWVVFGAIVTWSAVVYFFVL